MLEIQKNRVDGKPYWELAFEEEDLGDVLRYVSLECERHGVEVCDEPVPQGR